MAKLIDLTGKKFGRLTAIKRSYPNTKTGRVNWLCKCECGEEIIVPRCNLRNGNTRSCGCLQKELARNLYKLVKNPFHSRIKLGLANMRKLIRSYKGSAKRRGYEYQLTEKQFKEITQRNCYYCGIKPYQKVGVKRLFGEYIHNGIDRIDNTQGYVMGNVVSCCKYCNIAKNSRTIQEFKDWVERVYKNIYGDIN